MQKSIRFFEKRLKNCTESGLISGHFCRRMNERIKERREYFGLSQRELARRVGVGKITISEIEGGDRLPNVETAIRIARALETTVEQLWGG